MWQYLCSSITNSDLAGADTASPSFTPDTEGTYVLGLIVSDGQNTDSDNTAVTVTLPAISVLPEGIDLGSVTVGSSAAQTLTIMNTGSADLDIYSINIEGTDAPMFNAAAETCLNLTPVIAPGEDCTISITFSPSSTGIKSADLSIESGDPYNTNVIISLSGTGMNTPPAADAGGPYIGMEGQAITFDGSGSTDLNGDALQYQWDFDNDGTWDSGWSSSPIADYVWNDDWSGMVKLEISDGEFSDTDIVTVTVNNVAPMADNKTVTLDEDATIEVVLTASDPGDDELSFIVVDNPANGSLLGSLPNVTYTPELNFNGTDSFTYKANDGAEDSNIATVTITVNAVNDAPVVSTDTNLQTVQYSDEVALVTITASDIDSSVLQVSTSWTKDSGAEKAGLPDGLSLNTEDCTGNLEVTCIRVLDGKAPVVAGEYNIVIAVDDGEIVSIASTTINVGTEDVDSEFDGSNPIAIEVAEAGGNSGSFNLTVHVKEMQPDLADTAAYSGDINLAEVSMSLQPTGPGSPVSGVCSVDLVSGSGYEAVKTVTCGFDNVPVSTYTAELTINGNYYEGYSEDVVVIYDPGLGYVTGGGWFYWPGTENIDSGYPGDRTNFGFTMTYDEDGTNVQGDFLLISHLPDGNIYRVKSNALYGLSIGERSGGGERYDWSSFSGTSTYLEPGWPEPANNYEFTVYIEDHEKHQRWYRTDHIWIELVDQDGNVINEISMPSPSSDNTEELLGGDIIIPHDMQCGSGQ